MINGQSTHSSHKRHKKAKKLALPPASHFHSPSLDEGILAPGGNVPVAACDTPENNAKACLFPPWLPYAVWLATLLLRTAYVAHPSSWWILHPDEVFQSLEVAHTEVYGYGFRAYEFTSTKTNGGGAPGAAGNLSLFRQRELELGMYGMRSALYPRFFVLVSGLAALLGFHIKPFVLWRASHAAVASLLPLSVYRFSRTFFSCNDTACMASVFVACSLQLTVFGTHPLLNSFLAPAVFWAASVLCSAFKGRPPGQEKSTGHSLAPAVHELVRPNRSNDDVTLKASVELWRSPEDVILQQGGSVITRRKPGTCHERKTLSLELEETCADDCFADPSMLMNGGKKEAVDESWQRRFAFEWRTGKSVECASSVLCGLVISLCIYMRPDVAVFLGILLLPSYSLKNTNHAGILACAIGGCAGVGVGLFVDFRFYGELVVTPMNWAKFNIFDDLCSKYFSSSSFCKYFLELLVRDKGLASLVITSAVGLAILSCRNTRPSGAAPHTEHGTGVRLSLQLTCSWLLLLLAYSFKGHKELRFVHNVTVLILVTAASVFCQTAALCREKFRSFDNIRRVAWLCLILHAAFQLTSLPSARDGSNRSWAYQGTWDSHDVNACLAYVGDQHDVTGVFVDRNLFVTGGYSLLHRDVPVLGFVTHEFVEFDSSSKTTLPHPALLLPAKNVSFFTFDSPSNFVSVQNAPYLVKILIQKSQYNYVVITKERRFLSVGYQMVFDHGTMRVMKRTFDPDHERQLLEKASGALVGVNATVLQYEGDVLFRFQRYRLAAERYLQALWLDATHAQKYQGLAACAQKLGDQKEANRWMQECVKRFGEKPCSKPPTIANINPERQLI